MTAAELVWGMRLTYSESGQESKAARMGPFIPSFMAVTVDA